MKEITFVVNEEHDTFQTLVKAIGDKKWQIFGSQSCGEHNTLVLVAIPYHPQEIHGLNVECGLLTLRHMAVILAKAAEMEVMEKPEVPLDN